VHILFINPNNWKSGIYKITGPDGMYYYGLTKNFSTRWNTGHLKKLLGNRHENRLLQNKFNSNKTGWVFEAIEQVEPFDALLKIAEDKFLTKHFGTPECMNLSQSAYRPPSKKGLPSPLKGKKNPGVSVALKGRFLSLETKLKISNTLKGRKKPVRSAEHTEKIAASRRGKPWTESRRKAQLNRLKNKNNIIIS